MVKYYNRNLSIIVPGPCNGKCNFCFWKESKDIHSHYIKKLKSILNSIPEDFYQISLTGGEPTLSKYLVDILKAIDRNKYTKVVLTSNGTNLSNFLDQFNSDVGPISDYVDHINISRHHYSDKINNEIFKTKTIDGENLFYLVERIQSFGIDVTFNCVLTDNLKSKDDILNYINCAKRLNADYISFRKPHGNLEPSEQELLFSDYEIIGESSCPVCRSKFQRIEDMNIAWKASSEEPSKELGEMYELIIHPNCKVTLDWEGKIEMKKENSINHALSKIADALISIGNELKDISESKQLTMQSDSSRESENEFSEKGSVSQTTKESKPRKRIAKLSTPSDSCGKLGSSNWHWASSDGNCGRSNRC